MIVVQLKGGLGNQMFQYAAAKRLAEKHKTKLMMDVSWFDNVDQFDTPRFYELDKFKLPQNFTKRFSFVLANNDPSLKVRIYKHTKGLFKPRLQPYIEKGQKFDKAVLDLPDNTYLEGYWQNENYFKDIRSSILDNFSYQKQPSGKNKELIYQIESTNAFSLHVRRGDYASNKAANAFHGLMGLPYYKKAVELIDKKVKDPTYFIFSDDPDWTKENLKVSGPAVYVSHNSDGAEDMRLMSHCNHHVTANSSFSWWGAWLNPRDDKIVISPKRWFIDSSMRDAEIIPDNWTKI